MKLSVTEMEKEKEGKSKVIASCGYLEETLRECSKEERVTMEGQCGNGWSGLESHSQEVGSERKTQEGRSARLGFLLIKWNIGSKKSYMKVWGSRNCHENEQESGKRTQWRRLIQKI